MHLLVFLKQVKLYFDSKGAEQIVNALLNDNAISNFVLIWMQEL